MDISSIGSAQAVQSRPSANATPSLTNTPAPNAAPSVAVGYGPSTPSSIAMMSAGSDNETASSAPDNDGDADDAVAPTPQPVFDEVGTYEPPAGAA